MRKRIWIIAIEAMALATVTTAWAATFGQAAPGPTTVFTKDGLAVEEFQQQVAMQNGMFTPEHRESLRLELSGSTLQTNYLAPGLDQKTADDLAAVFRQQAPVPADRVAHFGWLDRAQQIVSFVGWGARFNAIERRADGLWVELKVAPYLEAERAFGGLTNDDYIETYVVRDGQFQYMGGKPAPLARREVRPDPESPVFFVFD